MIFRIFGTPFFKKTDIFLPIFDHINRSLCSFLSRITSSGEHRKSWICLNRFKNYNSFFPQKWKIAGLAFLKKPASPNFFKKLAKSHWLLMPYLSLVRYFFVKKCFWTKTVILFLGRVLGFTAVVFSEIHGWSGILSLFSSNLRGLFKRLSTLFSLLAIIYCHWTDFSAVELARFRVEIEIIFSEATENTKSVQV